MEGIEGFNRSSLRPVQTRRYDVDQHAERESYISSLPEGLTLLNTEQGKAMLAECSAGGASPSQHDALGPFWRVQIVIIIVTTLILCFG